MKLQGEHTFDAPRDRVWQALLDPDVLVNTLPGCERLEETGENRYDGTLNIQVGPVSGKFDGRVELLDLEPEEGYCLKLSGKGAPGFVHGEGSIRLSDAEGGGTKLTYDVDTQVGGRIASVGQRLLQSSSKVITRQALEGLEQQIAAREPGAAAPSAEHVSAGPPQAATVVQPTANASSGAAGSADSGGGPRRVSTPKRTAQPSQAEFAAQFAKGLFEEMVPKPYRKWVLGGAVLLLVSWIVSLGSRR